jgi:hypothetical protein
VGDRWRRLRERSQRILQVLPGVVADDDDGESSHRVARITWSVR